MIINHEQATELAEHQREHSNFARCYLALRAELSELRAKAEVQAVPEGWKLVPAEMTDEMYVAFCEARGELGSTYKTAYRAMLAAAPQIGVQAVSLATPTLNASCMPEELPIPSVTTSVLIDKMAGEQIADRSYAIGWNHCREAMLAATPQSKQAVSAPEGWSVMCGDWREELVSIHGPNGLIASGLTAEQATALVKARGGVSQATACGEQPK